MGLRDRDTGNGIEIVLAEVGVRKVEIFSDLGSLPQKWPLGDI